MPWAAATSCRRAQDALTPYSLLAQFTQTHTRTLITVHSDIAGAKDVLWLDQSAQYSLNSHTDSWQEGQLSINYQQTWLASWLTDWQTNVEGLAPNSLLLKVRWRVELGTTALRNNVEYYKEFESIADDDDAVLRFKLPKCSRHQSNSGRIDGPPLIAVSNDAPFSSSSSSYSYSSVLCLLKRRMSSGAREAALRSAAPTDWLDASRV